MINWAAWIHACARTGNRSYVLYAVVYAIPFMAAMVFDPHKKGTATDIVSGIAAVAWIAGIVHVMLQKDSVYRKIEDRRGTIHSSSAFQIRGSASRRNGVRHHWQIAVL